MSARRFLIASSLVLGLAPLSPCAFAGEKIQFSISGITSDRIEFSSPTAPIDVPATLAPEKPQPLEFHPAVSPDRLFQDDSIHAAAPQMIIITSGKKDRDTRNGDPASTDGSYGNDYGSVNQSRNPQSSVDRLLQQESNLDQTTNRWDSQRETDTGLTAGMTYQNRLDESQREDSLQSRLTALNPADRSGLLSRHEGLDNNWRTDDSKQAKDESSWAFTYFHRDPGYAQNHDGESYPSYMQTMAEAQNSQVTPTSASTPTVADDASSQNATQWTGAADYTARRREEAAAAGFYRPYQAAESEARASSLNPYAADTYYRQQQQTLYSSQAQQPPPAILPFPKRPGDVLK